MTSWTEISSGNVDTDYSLDLAAVKSNYSELYLECTFFVNGNYLYIIHTMASTDCIKTGKIVRLNNSRYLDATNNQLLVAVFNEIEDKFRVDLLDNGQATSGNTFKLYAR